MPSKPTKPADGAPVVVLKTYDFVLWLLPKVENFARSYRFTVGDRLAQQGLDLLVILVEAAYSSLGKERLLDEAIRKVNSTRYLEPLLLDKGRGYVVSTPRLGKDRTPYPTQCADSLVPQQWAFLAR